MNVPIFKRDLVYTLFKGVDQNLDYYRSGNLSELLSKPEFKTQVVASKKATYEPTNLLSLKADLKTGKDVENAIIVHRELHRLTPALAADERIWTALCHQDEVVKFIWDRWVKRKRKRSDQVDQVRKHFFCSHHGYRGITRYNALGSLWWMSYVAAKNLGDMPTDEAIKTFVEMSDLRSNLLDRSLSRVPNVFAAIISCYQRKLADDPETNFFKGRTGAPYREWLSQINSVGGLLYFAVMEKEELEERFWNLLTSVEQR